MADSKNRSARAAVKAAQSSFERDLDATHAARRKAFADAQEAGLSLREIAEEVGLHHTRVLQIIRGE